MTNFIILYEYYYRYRQSRKTIRDLVASDNFVDAQNMINSFIIENDNYINSNGIPNTGETFTSVDNLSLHHGRDHLTVAENNPVQKQATIDALEEG